MYGNDRFASAYKAVSTNDDVDDADDANDTSFTKTPRFAYEMLLKKYIQSKYKC